MRVPQHMLLFHFHPKWSLSQHMHHLLVWVLEHSHWWIETQMHLSISITKCAPEFHTVEWSCCYTLKLSPQPHIPLMLGLLKTNSAARSVWMKSISVPSSVNCALESMNTLTPAQQSNEMWVNWVPAVRSSQTLCIVQCCYCVGPKHL